MPLGYWSAQITMYPQYFCLMQRSERMKILWRRTCSEETDSSWEAKGLTGRDLAAVWPGLVKKKRVGRHVDANSKDRCRLCGISASLFPGSLLGKLDLLLWSTMEAKHFSDGSVSVAHFPGNRGPGHCSLLEAVLPKTHNMTREQLPHYSEEHSTNTFLNSCWPVLLEK